MADIEEQLEYDADVVFDDPWYDINLELGSQQEEQ
jgi:hypothetical protein